MDYGSGSGFQCWNLCLVRYIAPFVTDFSGLVMVTVGSWLIPLRKSIDILNQKCIYPLEIIRLWKIAIMARNLSPGVCQI